MRRFGVCGMQLYIPPTGSKLSYISARIAAVAEAFPWVEMVVLSELAPHGPNPAVAEPLPGPSEDALAKLAAKLGLWIVNGSMYELSGSSLYNTCSVIGPDGGIVGRYRKMFPFRPYSGAVEAGNAFFTFDVPGVARFGISICYDMWFPETSRTLAAMGAEVILHPVLTGTTDREVELSIARATAVQNQLYVVDVNGVGVGGIGRSLIVGPDGDVIHQAGQLEELMPFELDLDRVRTSRERGVHGLGQVLKGFRDAPVAFDVYRPDSPLRSFFSTLGPLEKPGRPVRGGGVKS